MDLHRAGRPSSRWPGEREFPLLRSALPAVEFIAELTHYLEHAFAPSTEVHGTLVDVYGVGLLFTGRSGIGKSECALDLIERGHRLVADDIVEITRTSEDVLIGRYRDVLRHHMEIRGVGVIDVQAIFGIRAIRMQKRIEVEVQLQDWDDSVDYERMGMEHRYTEILGVEHSPGDRAALPGQEHHGDPRGHRPELHAQDLRLRRRPGSQRAHPGLHAHRATSCKRYLEQDRE